MPIISRYSPSKSGQPASSSATSPQAFTPLALISGRYPPDAYRDLLLQSASGVKNVLSVDTAHLRTSQPTVAAAL